MLIGETQRRPCKSLLSCYLQKSYVCSDELFSTAAQRPGGSAMVTLFFRETGQWAVTLYLLITNVMSIVCNISYHGDVPR